MKTILTLAITAVLFLGISSCQGQTSKKEDIRIDLIHDEFPEAKQEVMETFGAIAQSIKDGDLDKLISFHAYGPKFTEFKNLA